MHDGSSSVQPDELPAEASALDDCAAGDEKVDIDLAKNAAIGRGATVDDLLFTPVLFSVVV